MSSKQIAGPKVPFLVKIDCKDLVYAQYHGRQRLVAAKSSKPLEDFEVEMFRVDPMALLGSDDTPGDPDAA